MTKSLMQSRLKALQARLQRLRKKGESAKKDLKKNATEDMDVEGEETVDLYAELDGLLGEVEAHTGAGQEDLFDIEEPAKLASKGAMYALCGACAVCRSCVHACACVHMSRHVSIHTTTTTTTTAAASQPASLWSLRVFPSPSSKDTNLFSNQPERFCRFQ